MNFHKIISHWFLTSIGMSYNDNDNIEMSVEMKTLDINPNTKSRICNRITIDEQSNPFNISTIDDKAL